MDNDKEVPLAFPTSGLNVATSYGQQPDASTPVGVNVRANESILNRARGGSRSGLSKYPPGILPSGDNVVQHMNVVVDPQGGALLAGSPLTDPSIEDPDPRWTRLIRAGGDGIQLNKNANRTAQQVFVQSQASQFFNNPSPLPSPQTMVFTSRPSSGNLLVVVVGTYCAEGDGFTGPAHPGVPKNGAGTVYTRMGSTGFVDINNGSGMSGSGLFSSLSAYYLVSTGSSSDQTVNVDPGGAEQITIIGLEYTTLNPIAPFDNAVTFTDSTDSSAAMTTGPIALSNTAGELVMAIVMMGNTDCSGMAPNGGYTVRAQSFGAQGGTGWAGIQPYMSVMDLPGVKATTATPTATLSPFATPSTSPGVAGPTFCSIGAGFKK